MKTSFDIGTPEELKGLYLGEGVSLPEKDQQEILDDIKMEIDQSSDDTKIASAIKLYLFRGDIDKAKELYKQIKDDDYAQSLGQEIIDARGLSGKGKAQDGQNDATTKFILGVASQGKRQEK